MAIRKEREVSVFRNGRSRAIRIPAEFKLEGDSVILSQDADGVIVVKPKAAGKSWAEIIAFLKEDPIDFPEIPDEPPRPLELDLDKGE